MRAVGVLVKVATGAVRSTTIGPAVRSALGFVAGPTLPATSVTEFAVITGIKVPSLHEVTKTEKVNPGTIVVSVKTHPWAVPWFVIRFAPKPITSSLN